MYKVVYNNLIKNAESIQDSCKQMIEADIKIKTNYIDPVTEITDYQIKKRLERQRRSLGIK